MGAPDIYLRSKVPEEMFYILQQFAEIRKLTRLALIRDFNLFPETEKLLTLERKYGDSLNFEDLYGQPKKPKKKAYDKDSVITGSIMGGTNATGFKDGKPDGTVTGPEGSTMQASTQGGSPRKGGFADAKDTVKVED